MLARRGEIVKRLGDGLMAAFWDARTAVEAAFEAHRRVESIVAGYRPRLRTGIHIGRPRKIGGDYFGIDVNIAARLLEAAGPGELLASERVLQGLEQARSVEQRQIAAKGAPAGLRAHVLAPARAG